jgi:hypothetical protein
MVLKPSEIFVRLVRSSEKPLFKQLMQEHHYPGSLPRDSGHSKCNLRTNLPWCGWDARLTKISTIGYETPFDISKIND